MRGFGGFQKCLCVCVYVCVPQPNPPPHKWSAKRQQMVDLSSFSFSSSFSLICCLPTTNFVDHFCLRLQFDKVSVVFNYNKLCTRQQCAGPRLHCAFIFRPLAHWQTDYVQLHLLSCRHGKNSIFTGLSQQCHCCSL